MDWTPPKYYNVHLFYLKAIGPRFHRRGEETPAAAGGWRSNANWSNGRRRQKEGNWANGRGSDLGKKEMDGEIRKQIDSYARMHLGGRQMGNGRAQS
jgi:hypothetical protein